MPGILTDRERIERREYPVSPRVYILFALREEAQAYWKTQYAEQRKRFIVSQYSSVGSANAARAALDMILVPRPIRCLIVCGFGGGLSERLKPGDLVLADEVTDGTTTFAPNDLLLESAKSVQVSNVRIEIGTLFTVDKVATTAAEKGGLAARTGAIAVDMETVGAVRVAQERGIPWLAVRAITDGVNDELPLDFNALANPDGSVNRGRVIRATLAQPHKIPALIRLGQRSSLAANNLAAFLVAFLQTLPETE